MPVTGFRKRLLASALGLYGLGVQAQPFPASSFTHVTTADGLAHGRVSALATDTLGYLWVGTFDGLSILDRHRPRNLYGGVTGDGLCLNAVSTIARAADGTMYVGTQGCISYYDYAREVLTPIPLTPPGDDGLGAYVSELLPVDGGSGLWIGVVGGGLLRGGRDRPIEQVLSTPADVYALAYGSERGPGSRSLYLGSEAGVTEVALGPGGHALTAQPVGPPLGKTNSLHTGLDGSLYVGTDGRGAWRFDLAGESYTRLPDVPADAIVRDISTDADGRLWIATDGFGVHVLARGDAGQWSSDAHFAPDLRRGGTIGSSTVYDILHTRDDVTYLGLYGGGLARFDPTALAFATLPPLPATADYPSDPGIRSIATDGDGGIWLGTRDGLMHYATEANTVTPYAYRKGAIDAPSAPIVLSLASDPRGGLYVGTFGGGLNRMTRGPDGQATFQHYRLPGDGDAANVYALAPYADGLLVGTQAGAYRFDPETEVFTPLPAPVFTHALEVLADGTVVFAAETGLYTYRPGDDTAVKRWPGGAGSASVLDVQALPGHRFLLAVEGRGVVDLTFASAELREFAVAEYGAREGLPGRTAVSVAADRDGDVWVGTYGGIARLDLERGRFSVYGPRDGVESLEFSAGASAVGPAGDLYFGGRKGLTWVRPGRPPSSAQLLPLRISGASLTTADTTFDAIGYWGKSLTLASEVTIGSDVERVTFAVAPPSSTTLGIALQYQLAPLSDKWVDIGGDGLIDFPHLPSGRYRLLVRALRRGGSIAGVTELSLAVAPPLHLRWYAWLTYALLLAGAIAGVSYYQHTRRRDALALAERDAEVRRREEDSQRKLKFFTDVSHELRTPLTLIYAPIKQLIGSDTDRFTPRQRDVLSTAHRNVERLRTLVNQLLDLRRLEAGSARLAPAVDDLDAFVGGIVTDFSALAEARDVRLAYVPPPASESRAYDSDVVSKIVYNLLDNALKFTAPGDGITVGLEYADPTRCLIRCADTGCGIPAAELENVFERYYTNAERSPDARVGTGIGLSLVRRLVRLHGGEVTVESTLDRGTTFEVVLDAPVEIPPATATQPPPHDNCTASAKTPSARLPSEAAIGNPSEPASPTRAKPRAGLPKLLVVEDNREIVAYVTQALSGTYAVSVAYDGLEGLALARRLLPAIILSDVLMPGLDGLGLAEAIRADAATAHIPIVLLTARTSEVDILAGYHAGVDDYLVKPFAIEMLTTRLASALRSRERVDSATRQLFVEEAAPRPGSTRAHTDAFMMRFSQAIDEHIGDSALTMDTLADELTVSRSVLFRKVKELTGTTPAEVLKQVRLNTARDLLVSGEPLAVRDIAHAVGFADAKYFGKCFSKQFGKAPTQYRKDQQVASEDVGA